MSLGRAAQQCGASAVDSSPELLDRAASHDAGQFAGEAVEFARHHDPTRGEELLARQRKNRRGHLGIDAEGMGRCELLGTGPVPPSVLDRISPDALASSTTRISPDALVAGIIYDGEAAAVAGPHHPHRQRRPVPGNRDARPRLRHLPGTNAPLPAPPHRRIRRRRRADRHRQSRGAVPRLPRLAPQDQPAPSAPHRQPRNQHLVHRAPQPRARPPWRRQRLKLRPTRRSARSNAQFASNNTTGPHIARVKPMSTKIVWRKCLASAK